MTVKNIGCLRQKMAIPLGTEENLRGERGQQEEKILRLADVSLSFRHIFAHGAREELRDW